MKKVYEELGGEIKGLRKIAGESIEDVCDAVEIPHKLLKEIESGTVRPEEDLLAMLLSHFEVDEIEAIRMWRMAGYNEDQEGDQVSKDNSNNKQENDDNHLRISIPADKPVLYTDMVQVLSNQYGVVLHFLQLSPNQQATVVSRIGMSKEHAKSLLKLLQKNLEDMDSKDSE